MCDSCLCVDDQPCSLAGDGEYLLACHRYIELNPLRALRWSNQEYIWSSYAADGLGKYDRILKPHDLYVALGDTDAERQQAYRELFKASVDVEQIRKIRSSCQTGTPLGNDKFRELIEEVVGRKVGFARRDRPSFRQNELKGGRVLLIYFTTFGSKAMING